jgi:AraC-like DNA-binding protein
MSMHQLFFTVDVIGFFSVLLFGLRVLIISAKQRNARLIALICFNSACAIVLARQDYAYWIPEAYQVHVGLLRIPLHIARNMTSGLLMILCHSLFQDESKFPRWLASAFALQVLMEFAGTVRSTNGSEWQHDTFQVAPRVAAVVVCGIRAVLDAEGVGRRSGGSAPKVAMDFLADRRHLHVLRDFAGAIADPWGSIAEFYVHLTLSMLLAMLAVFALLATFRSDEPAYIDPFRDETSRALPVVKSPVAGAHDGAIAAVRRAFVEQHVHRDGELTVASLAQKLAMPEYRLRKLIHEQLGYRNFNALLHDYRIAEASRDLADPAKRSLPILTIALTVGYNSINPFNRAFRDAKGMTPSAFRAQAQAERPVPPTQQSLTEI